MVVSNVCKPKAGVFQPIGYDECHIYTDFLGFLKTL